MNADIHTIFSTGECPSHEQLLAYFRGTLTGEEKNRIEHHLMECEMCSDELGGLSKMKDVDKLPEIVADIQSEIKAKQRKTILMNPRIYIPALAALILLLIGVVFIFRFISIRQHEHILTRQPEQALSQEMKKPVQPTPSTLSSPPPAASAGKPLLAVVRPPKKKDVNKEEEMVTQAVTEEKMVGGESEVKIADEEPSAVKQTNYDKALIVKQQDSATRAKALGYSSGVEVLNYNGKMTAIQPSPLAERKTDMKGMVKQGAGPGADDAGMILYQKADYQQASVLFEKKLEVDSANSATRFYLADCRFHLKEYIKAKQLLQKIITDPKDQYYVKACELLKKVEVEIK